MAQLKCSPPGRMMISVPAKPPITSSQRSTDTRSPSVSEASSVMTSGVIMTMAVNSPTGMYLRLKNANSAGGQQQHAAQALELRVRACAAALQPREGSMATVVAMAWKA